MYIGPEAYITLNKLHIKVCSNGGATYINSKLIAEANLNIAILMQTFENLSYSPKLFNRIL